MEQDGDSDTPHDNNQQRNRKLNVSRDRDMRVFFQKQRSEWAGCDTQEHGEPAICNRQWAFVYE